jgi:predicted aconitase with swiveling domain
MNEIILKGRSIVEGYCIAEALVSEKPISFLGGVNPADGKIVEKGHDLCGECIKDKVFCFPHGHGSTVGSYVLYSLAKKALAPKAIINEKADPVVVVGAIITSIPMVDQVDIKQIRTGDILEVDATKGHIQVLKKRRLNQPCT